MDDLARSGSETLLASDVMMWARWSHVQAAVMCYLNGLLVLFVGTLPGDGAVLYASWCVLLRERLGWSVAK